MALLSLFTTPTTAPPATRGGTVADAVRAGAQRSGVGFDFLLRTAQRESALDPSAKAGTSSATGLFQFIEQTWLQTVKLDGAKHGLQSYADAISVGSNGRYAVADPALRAEILALRRDPETSSALAGELTRRNGAALAESLGRQPTDGELYLAHVMGSRGAASLVRRAAAAPDDKAASYFPDEAAANRGIFYARGGRARTLAEVRDKLTGGFEADAATTAAATTAAQPAAASGAWLSYFPQANPAANAARPVDSLFRTDGARGPVSAAVARLWTPRADAEPRADSYYPLGSGEALPPPAVRRAAVAEAAQPAETSPAAPRRRRATGRPLDLQALMKPAAT